jgi:hypothetical protein
MGRIYEPNPKHKEGTCGDGPPRWFPDSASKCPKRIDAQHLLNIAISAEDQAHPDAKALFAVWDGRIYKAYCSRIDGDKEYWHGYPVADALVGKQVPTSVLRRFVQRGHLSDADYRKLISGRA